MRKSASTLVLIARLLYTGLVFLLCSCSEVIGQQDRVEYCLAELAASGTSYENYFGPKGAIHDSVFYALIREAISQACFIHAPKQDIETVFGKPQVTYQISESEHLLVYALSNQNVCIPQGPTLAFTLRGDSVFHVDFTGDYFPYPVSDGLLINLDRMSTNSPVNSFTNRLTLEFSVVQSDIHVALVLIDIESGEEYLIMREESPHPGKHRRYQVDNTLIQELPDNYYRLVYFKNKRYQGQCFVQKSDSLCSD